MTGGTIAGILLSDLIRGQQNSWSEVYNPNRLLPLSKSTLTSIGEEVAHTVHVSSHEPLLLQVILLCLLEPNLLNYSHIDECNATTRATRTSCPELAPTVWTLKICFQIVVQSFKRGCTRLLCTRTALGTFINTLVTNELQIGHPSRIFFHFCILAKTSLTYTAAVCPHMKCVVKWNPVDGTFDCPCHGSSFDKYGRLISGPAKADLKPLS